MNIPVWVEQQNGSFCASVLGAANVRVTAPSRDAAVAGLQAELEGRMSAGELLFLNVEPKGLLALAGKYKDDPAWHAMWDEIKTQAYRERDEEKAREFPE